MFPWPRKSTSKMHLVHSVGSRPRKLKSSIASDPPSRQCCSATNTSPREDPKILLEWNYKIQRWDYGQRSPIDILAWSQRQSGIRVGRWTTSSKSMRIAKAKASSPDGSGKFEVVVEGWDWSIVGRWDTIGLSLSQLLPGVSKHGMFEQGSIPSERYVHSGWH